MTTADRGRWDAKYAQQSPPQDLMPPDWLVRHASSLPPGRALDLATGYGHAAIWLAECGWDVTAIDVSPLGLRAARQLAKQRGATVNWVLADLDKWVPGERNFDLVTVFRFLDRVHLPQRIARALRAGGHLLYETFLAADRPENSSLMRNPAFLLKTDELPKLFAGFEFLQYEERNCPGESLASLLARKM